MRVIKTSVMFLPADPFVVNEITKRNGFPDDLIQPAQWCVAVELVVDNNPMSSSMHQYAFTAKPTAKQVRRCKRTAISEHERELAQFMADYPHWF